MACLRRMGAVVPATVPPLCPTFRDAATTIFRDYQAGRPVGLVPWETSFTDSALLRIATRHPHQVLAHRFDGKNERATGADWEWWFCSPAGITGLRVQAKRMDPKRDSFSVSKRVDGVQQAETLCRAAYVRRASPFYVLYGDRVPTTTQPTVAPGPCPHGPFDPTLWGAALVHASVVRARLAGPRPARSLLELASPWHHLVCNAGSTIDASARWFVIDDEMRRIREVEDVDGREILIEGLIDRAEHPEPAPADVVRAYRERNPLLIDGGAGLAGVVLVLDTSSN